MQPELKKSRGYLGYALMWMLVMGFLIHGQGYLLGDKNIIVGIFNHITAVLLILWLLRLEDKAVGLVKALALGSVLVVCNWLFNRSSLIWDATYSITLLAIMAGQVLVFSLHSPFVTQPVAERQTGNVNPGQRTRQMGLTLGLTILAMAAVVVWGKRYLAGFDYSGVINNFFVYRWDGVLGDISSSVFTAWGRLWVPGIYLAILVGSFACILTSQKELGVWKSLLWIYLLGNLGGLAIAYLSDAGLWIIPLKVRGIHYYFYNYAKTFKTFHELWAMMGTYATKEMFQYVSFPGTHPPFTIVLNWLLIRLTHDNLMAIGLLLGALAWTGVFPMYLLGREWYNREMGYYMAGLYLVMPSTLIINYVALDGLTASLVAWALAFLVMGSRREKSGWMFLAGLATAGIAATNYSTPLLIPAFFVVALMGLRDQGKWQQGPGAGTKAVLVKSVVFFLGIAVPYALIQLTTQGKFDYLAMMLRTISATRQSSHQHPWFVGGWMCWFGYFIHVGAVVTALYIVRWRELFRGDWRNDILPWAGLITLLTPLVLSPARQETEREYMLFNVFIVSTAALALWQGQGVFRYMRQTAAPARISEMGQGWRKMFFIVLALSYLNAVIIEMLVADHW